MFFANMLSSSLPQVQYFNCRMMQTQGLWLNDLKYFVKHNHTVVLYVSKDSTSFQKAKTIKCLILDSLNFFKVLCIKRNWNNIEWLTIEVKLVFAKVSLLLLQKEQLISKWKTWLKKIPIYFHCLLCKFFLWLFEIFTQISTHCNTLHANYK